MFSSSNFYAPDIGVLSAYSGETKTSTTTAVSSSPSNFYTNRIVLCNEANVLKDLFAKSVQAMIDGIERNKYNHHKGSVISRPVCLCERCQSWKFDLCAVWKRSRTNTFSRRRTTGTTGKERRYLEE